PASRLVAARKFGYSGFRHNENTKRRSRVEARSAVWFTPSSAAPHPRFAAQIAWRAARRLLRRHHASRLRVQLVVRQSPKAPRYPIRRVHAGLVLPGMLARPSAWQPPYAAFASAPVSRFHLSTALCRMYQRLFAWITGNIFRMALTGRARS